MKGNKKGQALIEFILILPIIILLLLAMMDIGKIFLTQSQLENDVENCLVTITADEKTLEEIKSIFKQQQIEVELLENQTTNFLTIQAKREINFITPLFNQILKNYQVQVKRVIPYE